MSVSRISSPADRVSVGQQILCAIKNRDAQGRFVLTIREPVSYTHLDVYKRQGSSS